MSYTVQCRAQVSKGCLHDRPTVEAFGEDAPMSEDGTFDGKSMVCDPCYVRLMPLTESGKALTHELPAAIRTARLRQGFRPV